jgi:hypothetical protein
MVKSKEDKECKEKTVKGKNNKGGYKEPKDPLTEKAPRHQAAMKKDVDAISDDVSIAQEAVVKDFEKKAEAEVVPDKDEESVILRYKDSKKDNLLEKVFAYEKMSGTTIPLDFESDSGNEDSGSFLVSVKRSEIEKFRSFMKDFEEIPFSGEIEHKIAEVQSKRSGRAVAMDKSIKANRVGRKDNPIDLKDWSENPARLDLLDVDAGEA